MDVRDISKWPLPGEEHPRIFPSAMGQSKCALMVRWEDNLRVGFPSCHPQHCSVEVVKSRNQTQAGVIVSVHYMTAQITGLEEI